MGAFTRKPQFTTAPSKTEILFNVFLHDAMDSTDGSRQAQLQDTHAFPMCQQDCGHSIG